MSANEAKDILGFERDLTVGQSVIVKWTAGSFGHYQAPATVLRVNRASVRVTLDEPAGDGGYPKGHEIVVPLYLAAGFRWAHFNRVCPRQEVQS